MQQNPETISETYNKYISDVASSLCSKDRYFIVYYDPKGYYRADYPKMKPYFIVYREEKVKTIKDLMNMFLEHHKQFEQLKDGMVWELFTGARISPKMTLEEFKKGVRTEKIDGFKIFVNESKGEWSDQAAVTTYLSGSHQFSETTYQAPFIIEDVKFYIYLPITKTTKAADVKTSLQVQIQRNLTVKVDIDNIELFFRRQETTVPLQDIHLLSYIGQEKEKFIVRFKTKVPLKLPPKQNNTFIVIRCEGIEKNMFDYDSIKDRKLIDVISQLLTDKKLKKIALALQDQLLRYNQKFNKLEKIFKNSSTITKHLIGYLIDESLAFQYEYKKLVKKESVDYQKILLKQKTNLKKRQFCDQLSDTRASAATQPHFKNTQHVSTVVYYTSELKAIASDNKKDQTIYSNMNRFMRENDFCDAQIMAKQGLWEYTFAAHLYHQLKNIEPIKDTILWRGIAHNHDYQKDEIVHFEQFNSTSTQMNPALEFAQTGLLMICNSKSAHSIKEYSVYQKQNQALVEPYTTWKVKNIWKLSKQMIRTKKQTQLLNLDEKTYKEWQKKLKKDDLLINLIIFEEIEKQKLPQMKSTVFLWVDDKTGEGKTIWQKIEEIKNTTVMIQLLTTAELQKWLKDHSQMVQDPQIELIMITNMTRVQKGKKEDKAGVYAIDAFKKYKPKGTVFVYIGWLQGTLKKLKEHNYVPDQTLIVSNQFQDMVGFLKKQGLNRK